MSFEKELRELEIVIDHYGAECNCCGQTGKMFLTVDRINGYLQRRRGQGGFELYRQIIKDGFPDDIQVLCFNCKLGRKGNGGICPHKTNWRVNRRAQPKKEGEINAQTMTTGHPMWDRFAESIATLLETIAIPTYRPLKPTKRFCLKEVYICRYTHGKMNSLSR